MDKLVKKISAVIMSVVLAFSFVPNVAFAQGSVSTVDDVISKMTMDEKISQMIIPAFRSFDGNNVTKLDDFPSLKEALRKHQYGGVILYGQNISGTEQVTRLLNDLQENNASIDASVNIPYLTTVDEEGGIVIRLNSGTRMTGNMAIGATVDAITNAKKTGTVLGEELEAVGFNTDFAPDIDVNNNPENPVIGTRSFSDDPMTVSKLGVAYAQGLQEINIVPTYKHFPGHGDTKTDSHIGTPSVDKTYEELKKTELVPFQYAIDNGADMIMTDHITYPLIDDEVTFGDGVTKGYYPATMSKKMITDILRGDMGFDGVVVTDALEMASIQKAGLVPGEANSTEYSINIAEKVINAGVDLLLLPNDLVNDDVASFYDDYIEGIERKISEGKISEERINKSVKRILLLKEKYGIFDASKTDTSGSDIEEKVAKALLTVGSYEHHETEMMIAQQAITLVKNDLNLLPLTKDDGNIVVLGRTKDDLVTIKFAIDNLKEGAQIDENTDVTIDYYYDSSSETKIHYTDETREKIAKAGIVIGFSNATGGSVLDANNPQNVALHRAIEDTHNAGGRFVLISQNLPYDVAAFQDADAIALAYLGSGLNIDPTQRSEGGLGFMARNANILAAVDTIFGVYTPSAKLPVNVPRIIKQSDGTLKFDEENLYNRGFGLSYESKDTVVVHRLYNPNSGEHLYTKNPDDVALCVSWGWIHEEDSDFVAYGSNKEGRVPVYRLYNPTAGLHHYTADRNEFTHLVSAGAFNSEGVAFYAMPSASTEGTLMYRLFNPYEGFHLFTTKEGDYRLLESIGWIGEGAPFRVGE